MSKTIRLTAAQALVRFMTAQMTVVDGREVPIFAGMWAIFGHGNVAGMGEALWHVRDELPTYRGQNEQSMALAAIGFAKAKRRRQIMIATSSIGPGALNMVTAAGTALEQTRMPASSAKEDAGAAGRRRIPSDSIVISRSSPGFTAKRSRMALGTTIRLIRCKGHTHGNLAAFPTAEKLR